VLMSVDRWRPLRKRWSFWLIRKAMAAIRKHREGRAVYHDAAVLDDL